MKFASICTFFFLFIGGGCILPGDFPAIVEKEAGQVDGMDGLDGLETLDDLPPLQCEIWEKICEGACIDTDIDRNNCGGCGVVCSETQICAKGMCGCPSGTTACGAECYDFLTEVLACGGCGTVCSYDNAGASCDNGICQMGACLEGFHDCNEDPSDGCESALADIDNCGACAVACGFSNGISSCDGGTCEFLGCEEGFEDCDGDTSNGCEVDLMSDAGNCGACGTICGTDDPWLRGCQNGSCACACGNGICDDDQERIDCPQDCPYTVVCGDGFCDARGGAENATKCPADCADLPECGVFGCSLAMGENFNNCSDCGDITPVLNDGVCGGIRERCNTSPADCGECNSCVFLE